MAYNEELAIRIRATLIPLEKHIEEKKMFGGLAFMYKGKMSCGVVKNDLMIRIVDEKYEDGLKNKHSKPMDFTKKVLKNFLYIKPSGLKNEEELTEWINLGIEHAERHANKNEI